MKLYVPEIGDKLKLTTDWTFDLHWEHRNESLIKHFFNEDFKWSREEVTPRPVTLKAGTILTVDRIYIRQGASEYSSLSFYASISESGKGNFGKPKQPRFWAKLSDCNKIEFEIEKPASKLKLVYGNIHDTKNDSNYYKFYGYAITEEHPESYVIKDFCSKVISARKAEPVLKVEFSADLTWESKVHSNLLGFAKRETWHARHQNVKYKLLTLDDVEIGNWKSFASLKKAAKEYVEKNNL